MVLASVLLCARAEAQVVTQRGFVEGRLLVFPQEAASDPTRAIGDLLARDEVFVTPAPWLRVAGGIQLRGNSHDKVEDSWRVDVSDRGVRRPRV